MYLAQFEFILIERPVVDPDSTPAPSPCGPFLTPTQCRAIDRLAIEQYGIPGVVLMENAGRGCAEQLLQAGCQGPVVILCGPGNNGGDGWVMGRHLAAAGVAVKGVVLGDPANYRGDAKVHFENASRLPLPIQLAASKSGVGELERANGNVDGRRAEWIVDAILGTGAQGPPRPAVAEVVRLANQQGARTMAIDLPTGLDGETGELREPTFRADISCTFVAAKTGFQRAETARWLGEIRVIEIGITPGILTQVLAGA